MTQDMEDFPQSNALSDVSYTATPGNSHHFLGEIQLEARLKLRVLFPLSMHGWSEFLAGRISAIRFAALFKAGLAYTLYTYIQKISTKSDEIQIQDLAC